LAGETGTFLSWFLMVRILSYLGVGTFPGVRSFLVVFQNLRVWRSMIAAWGLTENQ